MISAQALIDKFQFAIDNHWGYIWGTAGVEWTAAKQAAATREMTVKYGKQWIGHTVADCSGLFAWAFRQLGGSIYHGSNTIYRSYCSNKGKLSGGRRADGQELIPGTAVFTGTENEHGHIGLYIGRNTVIEAASTQKGVITSDVSNKKWTYWGELKDVWYGDTPAPVTKPTLRRGSKGEYVTLAQTELIQKGYDCGTFGADGEFGAATEKAVIAFQKDHTDETGKPLTPDGVIGQKTWWALDQTESKTTYTVTIPHLSNSQADALMRQYPGSTKTEERG
jgi:hypothetical protein